MGVRQLDHHQAHQVFVERARVGIDNIPQFRAELAEGRRRRLDHGDHFWIGVLVVESPVDADL